MEKDIEFRNTMTLSDEELSSLNELWNSEYPIALNYSSAGFRSYIQSLTDLNHVIVHSGPEIIGWYFDFIREGERWFGMILKRNVQGLGIGSTLLLQAKGMRNELNGWVIDRGDHLRLDGSPYPGPLPFYVYNEFEIINERLDLEAFSAVRVQWKSSQT